MTPATNLPACFADTRAELARYQDLIAATCGVSNVSIRLTIEAMYASAKFIISLPQCAPYLIEVTGSGHSIEELLTSVTAARWKADREASAKWESYRSR